MAMRWLDWCVARHNEHRYPLARFLFMIVMAISGPDLRAGMLLSVAILTFTTWLYLKVTREVRGGFTSLGDAVLPALLLSWSHAFNYLMGYQIAFTLHTASVSWLVWAIVIDANDRRSDLRAACAVASLPLSSGLGLASAAPACGWLLYRAWVNGSQGRGSIGWHLLTGGLTSLAAAAYAIGAVVGVQSTTDPLNRVEGFTKKLIASGQFLAIGSGIWIIDSDWFTVILVTTAWYAAIFALLAWVFWHRREERVRTVGFVAVMVGIVLLALAIGWGRSGGLAERYATPAALGLATSWAALVRYNTFRSGRVLPILGTVLAVFITIVNINPAIKLGDATKMQGRLFTAAVREGLPPLFLAKRFYDYNDRMQARITTLGEHRYPGMQDMAADRPFVVVSVPGPVPNQMPACDGSQFFTARPSLPMAPPGNDQPVLGLQLDYELDHNPYWLELHFKWIGRDGQPHVTPVYFLPRRGRRTVAFWVNDVPKDARLEPGCVTLGVRIHRVDWLVPK